jgi:hypothetical protein
MSNRVTTTSTRVSAPGKPRYFVDVHTRVKWGDPWNLSPKLEPIAADVLSLHSATKCNFRYLFGSIAQEFGTAFQRQTAGVFAGLYFCVRIMSDEPLVPFSSFVGFMTGDAIALGDTIAGYTAPRRQGGERSFECAGLEYFLGARRMIDSPMFHDGLGPTDETLFDSLTDVLDFNARNQKGPGVLGNRSTHRLVATGPPTLPAVYGFGNELETTTGYRWTHRQIIEALLHWTVPPNGYVDETEPLFTLDGSAGVLGYLDAMTFPIRVAGRSVLDIIRAIIDRRRGLSAVLEYDTTVVTGLPTSAPVRIRVFSMLEDDLELDESGTPFGTVTVPANPNRTPVDYVGQADVDVEVRNEHAQRVERIVVTGEPMQVMFTAGGTKLESSHNFARLMLVATSSQRVAYDNADDATRRTDKHKEAYAVFRMVDSQAEPPDQTKRFDWQTTGPDPLIRKLHPATDDDARIDSEINGPTFDPTIRFQKFLTLPDLTDRTAERANKRFARSFALVGWQKADDTPSDEIFIDVSNTPKPGEVYKNQTRSDFKALPDVSADLHLHDGDGLIEVRFRHAAHVLGKPDFVGDSSTKPVFDHRALLVTVNVKTYNRPRVVLDLSGLNRGAQRRTMLIQVPDAHLWHIVQGTVSAIDDEGRLVTETGRELRNDTHILRHVAQLAAVWYGRDRIRLKVSRVGLEMPEPIGTLVELDQTALSRPTVRSVVTGHHYHYDETRSGYSTDALDLDVRPV